MKGFRQFILRGNVVDLAVAVVIGAAFGAVVTAFVTGVINPIIGLLGGHNFDNLVITLQHASHAGKDDVQLKYGEVISAVINFVLVAAAIFFLIIKPLNVLAERRKRGQESEEEAPPTEAELLLQIRDLLAARK
jgi:large conductance mechanosensitive channel